MAEAGEAPVQGYEAAKPELSDGGEVTKDIPKAPVVTLTSKPEQGKEVENKVDVLMVFGQGPVKPLLRQEELGEVEVNGEVVDQKKVWEDFKKDPLHNTEPDFRVIEGEAWTSQLEALTPEQQDAKITEWQTQGRFGLNRWGRENGLDAGFALVTGSAKTALLSGGETIPVWAKKKLSAKRLESWPSEAELMADIIKRRFGRAYQEKYGRSIDQALIIEDASTNTLENVANTINQNPELIEDSTQLGLLATDFHIERSEQIAALFAPSKDVARADGAQEDLTHRNEERQEWRDEKAKVRKVAMSAKGKDVSELEGKVDDVKINEANKTTYRKLLKWLTDPENPDLKARQAGEQRFMTSLSQPGYINYWIGYVGLVEDPQILQDTVDRFKSDPEWSEAARGAFKLVDLDFDDIAEKDIVSMPSDEFKQLSEKLVVIKNEHRTMAPPVPVTT